LTIGVEEAADDIPEVAAFFNCVLNMWLIVMYVEVFKDPLNEQVPEELASNVLSSIPGLVGPTRFAPPAHRCPTLRPPPISAAGLRRRPDHHHHRRRLGRLTAPVRPQGGAPLGNAGR
jgi:hypothetical protein